MKLSQLKYFQVVCKHNNLTRAAEELHISQPGLTHVIQEMEQEFGLTLVTAERLFCQPHEISGQSNQIIRMGLPPASATLFFFRPSCTCCTGSLRKSKLTS